jgi:hypothetical protein
MSVFRFLKSSLTLDTISPFLSLFYQSLYNFIGAEGLMTLVVCKLLLLGICIGSLFFIQEFRKLIKVLDM